MRIKQKKIWQTLKDKRLTSIQLPKARLAILICIVIFVAGFYLGGYTPAPASLNTQIKGLSGANLTLLKNYIRGKMSQPRKMTIDIKHKDFQFLEFKRAEALKRGKLIKDVDSYVPAWVTVDGQATPVRIRLKGGALDHLEGDKWSFRIKVKGENAILGMRRFSIQAPKRSGWAHEWVMYEWFRKEGLISLRYDYIDLTINGKRLGIYALEESFSKELIENNQRREGPILKWDVSLFVDKRKTTRGDMLKEEDLFHAADVVSFSTTKIFANDHLRDNFHRGRHMLFALRKGEAKLSDVFDVERAAKSMAILRIINALHGARWKNCRFYFNPVTSKMELIAYNAYGPHPIVAIKKNSMPLYTAVRQDLFKWVTHGWFNLLFSDPEFVKLYFAALDRFTGPGYLESFFKDISGDLKLVQSYIFKDEPSRSVRVPVYFYNRDIIRSYLYPKLTLKAYLNQYDGKVLRLAVSNPRFLPVVIDGIDHTPNGQFQALKSPVRLEGKAVGRPLELIDIEVPAPDIGESLFDSIRNGDTMILANLKIRYHTPGIEQLHLAPIDAYPLVFSTKFGFEDDSQKHLEQLAHAGLLTIDANHRQITINPGIWTIEDHIVVPKGFTTTVAPGSNLILNSGAALIAYGPVKLNGTAKAPVVLKSTDGTGQGLVVISAESHSSLNHVIFDNLTSLARKEWNLTGVVTFYESNVEINHVEFANNHSEDYLNIIRSKFEIRNCRFRNSFGDALDVDFGEGKISDSRFESCGNDCLDFAGSKAEIQNSIISGAGDKGMSVGEKSVVRIAASSVSRANIALAGKDTSKVFADRLQIFDSKIGFAVYQKKPEFGGAQIIAKNTKMTNVHNKYVGDSKSRIIENDQVVNTSDPHGIIQ